MTDDPAETAADAEEHTVEPADLSDIARPADVVVRQDVTDIDSSGVPKTTTLGVAALLPPLVAPGPGDAPVQSPAEWALLAWSRRQLGAQDPDTSDDTATGQLPFDSVSRTVGEAATYTTNFAAAAESAAPPADPLTTLLQFLQRTFFNQSPTATPIQISQSAAGVISGTVGALDPDDDPLIYTVTQGPAHGTVVVNADGSYLYTPNTALAGSGGEDSFTVTVTEANAADHIHGAQGLLARLVSALTGGAITLPDGSSITVGVPVHVTPVSTGVVGTIDNLGGLPQWLVFNDSGSRAYVVNLGADTVSVIDTATGFVVDTVPVGASPSTIWRQPNSTLAWLTNRDGNSVAVLDTATGAVIDTIGVGASPLEIGFSPSGDKAYVTNGGSSSVTIIDTTTRTVDGYLAVGPQPAGVAVTPDGQYLYVANQLGSDLLVFDRGTGVQVADIAVGAYPTVIAFGHDGSTAYITNEFSDSVYLVDTATRTVVGTIAVGTTPIGIVLSADGSRAYVTNFAGRSQNDIAPGTVSVIDTATNTVIDTITVGYGPVSSAITPDGSRLWVVNSGGSISIVALAGSTSTAL